MDGRLRDDEVVVGGDARQRFYDARGYGRPLSGDDLALSWAEAAHLLYRGDLDAVVTDDGRRLGFRAFLAVGGEGFAPRFLVYKDLRDRGFYLSAAREGYVDAPDAAATDFVVYPRGSGPWDDEVEYRARAVGERTPIAAADMGEVVLAIVDEESEITYLETDTLDPAGGTARETPAVEATLLDDRAVAWDPPASLYGRTFYGQPLGDRDDAGEALQLSLVEAAYLAAVGGLSLTDVSDGDPADGDPDGGGGAEGTDAFARLVERGRAVEGARFDRRLRAYRELRDRGLAPKTGFKFGADFRVYETVTSVDELGHAEHLVRVLPADHAFDPRALALDVRLAHGVRKRMLFARQTPSDTIDWLSVSRLTP